MAKFVIEMNYVARITQEVEADDEGEALTKAQALSDEADIRDFTIVNELESNIVTRF